MILIVNPWIHDFAAFDLWASPLGALRIASMLRQLGFRIQFLDFMDMGHPSLYQRKRPPVKKRFGTKRYYKELIPRPAPLEKIDREYYRYGIPKEIALEELESMENPSLVLVTSTMTYWYTGVRETIELIKGFFPSVPVLLGGIYPRLLPGHARLHSGADLVFSGQDLAWLPRYLNRLGILPQRHERPLHPYPAYDLLKEINHVGIQGSVGCPFRCSYCASPFLNPFFKHLNGKALVEEVRFWSLGYGVRDFALFDDAFLFRPRQDLIRLLEGLASLETPIRIHTPNALHASKITLEVARLLKDAHFVTIRLGLETLRDKGRKTHDTKLKAGEMERAIESLFKAGFGAQEMGVYVLAGLPGQVPMEVWQTLEYALGLGVPPYLAEYSPIPHTALWEEAIRSSEYDIKGEPLYQNNTLLPCWPKEFREEYQSLKTRAIEIRRALAGKS